MRSPAWSAAEPAEAYHVVLRHRIGEMQRRRVVGQWLAVAVVLLGLGAMHGLPSGPSHAAAGNAPAVASTPLGAAMLAAPDLPQGHAAHGLCVCACVLAIGIASVAFSIRRPRHRAPVVLSAMSYASNGRARCRRGHPPPRRLSLLAISLR
jgi:hypothetical protein